MSKGSDGVLFLVVVVLSAALAVVWFQHGEEARSEAPATEPAPPEKAPSKRTSREPREREPMSYAEAVTKLDQAIASRTRFAEGNASRALHLEALVGMYIARAALTGDYEDYERAERLLDEAFELSRRGGGPLLARARLHLTLHRVERAGADLERAEDPLGLVTNRAEILGLRGDVHFYSGRYEEARNAYGEAHRIERRPETGYRLSLYFWKTGDYPRAERLLSEVGRMIPERSRQARAYLALRFGLIDLDRGRYREALAHYQEGARIFPGWWLIEEHIAEIHAIEGRTEEAIRMYRDLVERTRSPEFMDALADALEERDEVAEAELWRSRAREVYEERLQTLPEATYGHALDHFLADPGVAGRALELARANADLRPWGESRVKLAQALVQNDRLTDAVREIEAVLATPYRSPELHATASLLLGASGDATRAAAERERAVAMNPDAMEDVDWIAEALRPPAPPEPEPSEPDPAPEAPEAPAPAEPAPAPPTP
jgi:tetratricopeptide (TPR) repeat protein